MVEGFPAPVTLLMNLPTMNGHPTLGAAAWLLLLEVDWCHRKLELTRKHFPTLFQVKEFFGIGSL